MRDCQLATSSVIFAVSSEAELSRIEEAFTALGAIVRTHRKHLSAAELPEGGSIADYLTNLCREGKQGARAARQAFDS